MDTAITTPIPSKSIEIIIDFVSVVFNCTLHTRMQHQFHLCIQFLLVHNVCTFKRHHENISIFLFREDYVGVNNFYSCDDNSTQTYLTISDIDVLAQMLKA